MRKICLFIEQLDLAAQQLRIVDPSYGRFALLITDNIIELMLHEQCRRIFDRDKLFAGIGKNKFSESKRHQVLGQHFDEKPKFLRSEGMLSDNECFLVCAFHRYRNELYHIGIKYDSIIYPLAWVYHSFACEFLARYKPGGYSWGSGLQLSDAVQAHLGIPDLRGAPRFEELQQRGSDSLRRAKPDLHPQFSEQISNFMVERLQQLRSYLAFLVADCPLKLEENQLLRRIQLYEDVFERAGTERLLTPVLDNGVELEAMLERAAANWNPRYPESPLDRWSSRATALSSYSDPGDVMLRFERLREESRYLDDVITRNASDLDGWIQHQIDVARGK